MTDIKSIPYFTKLTEKCKEEAFSNVFEYIHDMSEEEILQKYQKELSPRYSSKEIKKSDRDLSLPSSSFMEKVKKDYEKDKKFVQELFENGDCLTYKINTLDDDNYEMFHKQLSLIEENKFLSSPKALFSLHDENNLILFSDGTLLIDKKYVNDETISHLKKIIAPYGYEVKNILETKYRLSKKINAFARKKYRNEVIVKELPSVEEFITELFKDGNICITATNQVMLEPFSRTGFAYFSNGRMIVSKECQYSANKPLYNTLSAFWLQNKNYVFLAEEIVPVEYIEAIYEKAKEFSWHVGEEENTKKEPSIKKENKHFNEMISEKRGTNKCLTITNLDNIIKNDRDNFLLFEDGTLLVNKDTHYSAPYSPIETLIAEKMPKMKVTKKAVSIKELHEAYDEALKTQKSCKEIFAEILKKKAKKLGKIENIPHHQALEAIAKRNNFNNWKEVCGLDEDFARACIDREKEAKFYLDTFFDKPQVLAKEKNISLEEARDIVAQKYNFKNWEDLLIGSYFEIMEMFK